jgi:hypothetical protein
MKKRMFVFALAASLLTVLAACSPQTFTPAQSQGIQPAPLSNVNRLIREAEARGEKGVQILDVSQGKARTNAAIALTLKFAEPGSFSTKANANGIAPTLVTAINDYRAYLYECNAALPAAGAAGSETDLNGSSACTHVFNAPVADNNAATQTLVFNNIPANTAGSRYVVGIVARTAGPGFNSLVTTAAGGSGGYIDTTAARNTNGPMSLTLGGGDGAAPGSVMVNALNEVSSTANLTAAIRLADGVGARLESDVTVTPGNGTAPGGITLN